MTPAAPTEKAHRKAETFKSPAQRKRLKARKKPYWLQIERGLCVGYLRRTDPKVGIWYGRRELGRKPSGQYQYANYDVWRLEGVADDAPSANGEKTLSLADAIGFVKQQAIHRGSGIAHSGRYNVKHAIEEYLKYRAGKKGEQSRLDAEGKLSKWVLSHPIANIELNKLSLHDLHAWQASIVRHDDKDADVERRTKDTANRVLRDLKAALNHAVDNKKTTGVSSNEEWGRKLKPLTYGNASPTKPREYHFDIPTALKLIDAAEASFANLLRAAFYTGARPGDLMKLKVKDFRPSHHELRIPKGKTDERTTTLTAEAVEFFRSMAKDRLREAPLLTKADGTAWGQGDQKAPMREAVIGAELFTEKELDNMARRERPCLYSMRHTYISRSIEQGMPLLLIAQNVGNSVAMIEKHYSKIIERTRRSLIEQGAPSLRREGAAYASA